jgi:hypothetical protein
VLIRPATPDDAAGIAAVRRVSWPAAYAGIMAPEVIDQVVARATEARERAAFTERPWRHLLVAENPPGPAVDPAVAPVTVITGYASYGIERSVDGLPRSPPAASTPVSRAPPRSVTAGTQGACYQPRARHSPRCGRSVPRVVSAPWPG